MKRDENEERMRKRKGKEKDADEDEDEAEDTSQYSELSHYRIQLHLCIFF